MGKTQKRAHTPEYGNTVRATGSRSAEGMDGGTGTDGPDERVLPRDAAGYIHEMAIELKDIAESTRFSFLAYLLDLVIEESGMQKRGRL